MTDFLFLNENNAIRISEISRVSRAHNGKVVEFYLQSGGVAVKEDLEEPVTLAHVCRMIALVRVSVEYHDLPFVDWDDLSARVSAMEKLTDEQLNANYNARIALGALMKND